MEAVSEDRTLLWAQSEPAGVEGLPVLTDKDINFLRLENTKENRIGAVSVTSMDPH